MSLIGQVFLKIFTPKDESIKMDTWASFLKPCGSERLNELLKLLKSAEKHFYYTFSSLLDKLSQEKLFLIRFEISGLPVNTLSANCEFSRSNRENLPLPIQIKLSKKLSVLSGIFFPILESTFNLQCSEKNKPNRSSVFEVIDFESCAYLNP